MAAFGRRHGSLSKMFYLVHKEDEIGKILVASNHLISTGVFVRLNCQSRVFKNDKMVIRRCHIRTAERQLKCGNTEQNKTEKNNF